MIIYPAIDLQNGKCVRLYQGDFEKRTHYDIDPILMAKQFQQEGATWLHIIDLDAAKDPIYSQAILIKTINEKTNLHIQTGGGIRTEEQIETLLASGIKRVIIGSQAVKSPEFVKTWFKKFGGDQLVLAVDVKCDEQGDAYVATDGWQSISDSLLTNIIQQFRDVGLKHILCTDIQCDGTLQGPNIELYKRLLQQYPDLEIQASGGVSSLEDLKLLANANLPGAIVGRALYEKRFTLSEAIQC